MKTPASALFAALTLVITSLPLEAQSGLISGVVLEVQTSEGEPAGNVPIRVVGSDGAPTVTSTSPGGSATVPYSSSSPTGTRFVVVGVSRTGGRYIALVPEGETLEECEDSMDEERACEDLGVLRWGQTRSLSLRFGTAYARPGDSGSASTFSAGPSILRSRELESFGIGAQFSANVLPAFSGGSWILSGGVNRYSLTNSSVWAFNIQAGVQVPVASSLSVRASGGMLFDRQSSEFSSGTESGYTLNIGGYYFPRGDRSFSLYGQGGVADRFDVNDIVVGLGVNFAF